MTGERERNSGCMRQLTEAFLQKEIEIATDVGGLEKTKECSLFNPKLLPFHL